MRTQFVPEVLMPEGSFLSFDEKFSIIEAWMVFPPGKYTALYDWAPYEHGKWEMIYPGDWIVTNDDGSHSIEHSEPVPQHDHQMMVAMLQRPVL